MGSGTVYLVGVGPGDPDLITVKGMELLKKCDAVIYDRLVSYQLLEYTKEDCMKIYAGKEAGNLSKNQDEINDILIDCAGKYDTVVRLKGGDSFVFGRGGEEIEALMNNDIPFEVIPGITSAIAVPEMAGIPVTHRGVSQSFHVITGHTQNDTLTDNYQVLAKLDGTLVFLMGLSNIEKITERLIRNGKNEKTPAAVISCGTMNNQKTVRGTLGDIAAFVRTEKIGSPAIIVIGDTAAFNFTNTNNKSGTYVKPLKNIKIGITGTVLLREKLWKGLRNAGAEVYSLCAMHIEETPFIRQLEEELQMGIDKYQWIVFTSQNAISIFFDAMKKAGIDRRILNNIRFAVLGSGTGDELKKYGYFADFIPAKYTTSALATELSAKIDENSKILIPRALKGSKELTDIFQEKGIKFTDISVYDIKGKLTENKEFIPQIDCLVFASASGVDTFFEEIQYNNIQLPDKIKIACIGDTTANAVRKYDLNADIAANVSNADGLIEAIQQLFPVKGED